MEPCEELKTFIKIWFLAITSLCYCYFVSNQIRAGYARLLSLLPVIVAFVLLPLQLSIIHLAGPTIFYLVWLGNFKLVLFAFNRGPLASTPHLQFTKFITIALLPINPQQSSNKKLVSHKPILLAIKALILALIVNAYSYRDHFHPYVILGFYCCHVYLGVELVLALTAYLTMFLNLGFEIEPQFNEPYLATSLQDFWGRRWNLMVSRILRPTVYDPVREITSPYIGKLYSRLPAIFFTFLVSGLMHELIYFYLTRARPTWEVTWFFVLHGVCTALEVAVKKAVNDRFRLHRAVSGLFTVVFVAVTGVWLFLPQILRNGMDIKAIDEYYILVNFLRSLWE